MAITSVFIFQLYQRCCTKAKYIHLICYAPKHTHGISFPTVRYLYNLLAIPQHFISFHLIFRMIDLLKTLQQSKNARFNLDVTTKSVGEFNYDTDLNHMRFLVDSKLCFGYNDYKNVSFSVPFGSI